ncbi:MAG: MFS transporter [Dehalococcoidia bacterium]
MAVSREHDEALTRAGLHFSVLMAGLENGMFSFVFLSFMNSYLLTELHAGAAAPGYTLAAYSAIVLIVNTVAGALLDRLAPSRILAAVVALQLTATAVLFLTHSFAGFMVAAVLLALGAGGVWPLVWTVLGITQPLGRRAGASAAISVAGYATTGGGLGLGVTLGALAPPWVSMVVIGAAAATPLIWVGSPVLTRPRPEGDRTSSVAPRRASFQIRLPRIPGIRAVAALLFLSYGSRTAIAVVYGPYALLSLNQSLLATVPYLVPAGALALATLWLVPRWSRTERRRRELGALFVAAAVGAVLMSVAPTVLLAGIAAIPLVIGITACAPLLAATVLDVGSGESSRGLIFGSLLTIEGIGTVAMRALAAVAIDFTGPRGGLLAVAAMFAVLVFLAPFAPAPSRETDEGGRSAGRDIDAPPRVE